MYGLRRTRTCVSLGARCARNSISYQGCAKRLQRIKKHLSSRITMHNCTCQNTQRARAQKQRPFGCDHHKFSDRVSLHTCQSPGSFSQNHSSCDIVPDFGIWIQTRPFSGSRYRLAATSRATASNRFFSSWANRTSLSPLSFFMLWSLICFSSARSASA